MMMTGIGTPSSHSNMPLPILASSLLSENRWIGRTKTQRMKFPE
jgi:hypothetical protein